MSRPTQPSQIKIVAIAAALILIIGGGGAAIAVHYQPASPVVITSAPTTELSYPGKNGQTALALLKQHAAVQTKSSSLGEFVSAINGNNGGGKKYWIFYVNGKEAEVGAGAYVTHNGDAIEWKLQ